MLSQASNGRRLRTIQKGTVIFVLSIYVALPWGFVCAASQSERHNQKACSFRLLNSPKIEVPESLSVKKLNRMPLLKFEINEDGSVSKADFVKSSRSPEIDELILKSVKKWTFAAAPGCGVRFVRSKIVIDLR